MIKIILHSIIFVSICLFLCPYLIGSINTPYVIGGVLLLTFVGTYYVKKVYRFTKIFIEKLS